MYTCTKKSTCIHTHTQTGMPQRLQTAPCLQHAVLHTYINTYTYSQINKLHTYINKYTNTYIHT